MHMTHRCHYARNNPKIYPCFNYKNSFFMLGQVIGDSKLHFEISFYIKTIEKLSISVCESKRRKFTRYIRLEVQMATDEGMIWSIDIYRAKEKLWYLATKRDMTKPLKNKAGMQVWIVQANMSSCTKNIYIYIAWALRSWRRNQQ
jgi:hypothetical protein